MNVWTITAAVVFVFVVPVLFVAWSICKVASDADDAMEEW